MTITNNGGIIGGTFLQNSPAWLPVILPPAGATNLPLGATSPGAVNINTAADSVVLTLGDYVVANMNVNFPGSISISPSGTVRIFVIGNLNLGGNVNLNGVPKDLEILVASSGWVNVNS
jgi:hypothetical protein